MEDKDDTILITGGAGFIGSQFAKFLLEQGHEDIVLVDDFSGGYEHNLYFENVSLKDYFHELDIGSDRFETLFEVSSPDYVYHFAAMSSLPQCQANPKKAIEQNVANTAHTLEMSRKYGVDNFILASSGAIYENTQYYPEKETDNVNPNLIYPITKQFCEDLCASFFTNYGLNYYFLRYYNVYGPHQNYYRENPPLIGYIIQKLMNDETPVLHSDGAQERDYIYIDDLNRMNYKVMKHKPQSYPKGFNCCTGQTHSVMEIYNMIANIMGKNIEPRFEEPTHLWENHSSIFDGELPISESVVENEINKHTEGSNYKAREHLGWNPEVSMREGLEEIVDYVKKNRGNL